MSDYQAIYDAVAFNFSGASHMLAVIQEQVCIAIAEQQRPSVLYRPDLTLDGNAWIALYGDNLQVGVTGVGNTPAEAMADFDANWRKNR